MGSIARWKWGFLLVAVLAFLSGCYDALAAPASYPNDGPNWSAIAKWAASALLALVAFYAKALERRVTKLEEIAAALQRSLDRDYLVKPEVKAEFDKLERRMNSGFGDLNARLDSINVPRARRLHMADEE
jgi:hypothetical protein